MIDVVIIILLLIGIAVGAKKGFTHQLVDTVGTIAIIILSFLFKGYVSEFLYRFMPFFNFSGEIHGLTSLNILLYEVVAFFIIFSVLSILLLVLKLTTSLFEKMIKATIVLGIPSKILGGIVGLVNNFIFVFVVIYLLNLPVFVFDMVKKSNVANFMLNNTPLLSTFTNKTLTVFDDFDDLLEEYKNDTSSNELNQKTLESMVNNKIVSSTTVNDLIRRGKLKNVVFIEE